MTDIPNLIERLEALPWHEPAISEAAQALRDLQAVAETAAFLKGNKAYLYMSFIGSDVDDFLEALAKLDKNDE